MAYDPNSPWVEGGGSPTEIDMALNPRTAGGKHLAFPTANVNPQLPLMVGPPQLGGLTSAEQATLGLFGRGGSPFAAQNMPGGLMAPIRVPGQVAGGQVGGALPTPAMAQGGTAPQLFGASPLPQGIGGVYGMGGPLGVPFPQAAPPMRLPPPMPGAGYAGPLPAGFRGAPPPQGRVFAPAAQTRIAPGPGRGGGPYSRPRA